MREAGLLSLGLNPDPKMRTRDLMRKDEWKSCASRGGARMGMRGEGWTHRLHPSRWEGRQTHRAAAPAGDGALPDSQTVLWPEGPQHFSLPFPPPFREAMKLPAAKPTPLSLLAKTCFSLRSKLRQCLPRMPFVSLCGLLVFLTYNSALNSYGIVC